MDEGKIRRIPLDQVTVEEGAQDLIRSEDMRPYLSLMKAILAGKDSTEASSRIAELPLEKRYIWRIVSALKWAFADFDDMNVEFDRDALSPADRKKIVQVLKHRPVQFCMFLTALFGAAEMERIMSRAIEGAKQSQ